MASVLKVGLVGAGSFAGYHAQKLQTSKYSDFKGIFDVNYARAKVLCEQHKVMWYETLDELADNCDAVIVACPASLHYTVAEPLLKRGCHLLVEKPLALNQKHADRLVILAEQNTCILQVGHQERVVCRAFGLFDINERPLSVEIVRTNPPPQKGRSLDVSVIWDLMIHDIDLTHALLGETVEDMACKALSYLGAEYDEASASFRMGETQVKLHASRITKQADRHMEVKYASGRVKIDFLTRTLENTTPHKLVENLENLVTDPLMEADEIFFKACLGQGIPLVTGKEAARAVATAESLSKHVS